MTLASFFHWQKYIYSDHTKKTEDEHGKIIRTSINQEERRRDNTPSHTINVQSMMASDGESQAADITPVLADHGMQSKLLRSTSLNLILLDLKRALHISAGQCASA